MSDNPLSPEELAHLLDESRWVDAGRWRRFEEEIRQWNQLVDYWWEHGGREKALRLER